ncbi:MAG: orotidine-5'-phosphate decarboxylase [Acidobacteria bacterium]|nr:orotidine-5'-phosphate decarboxylase [Acidobacteriota bacterium]MBV9477330.1 orotidine-5'-phosphate decarboxylase [Acidobacteriota bacterium]
MQARDRLHARLVVAVDVSQRDDILRLVDSLHGVAGVFKIGLQAFIANGPSIVRELVARGERVFLDLKIHDIPNTAQHAIAEAAELGAFIATVHTAGGSAMLRACAHGSLLVLGVTILTSLDDAALAEIGFAGNAVDNAVRLARLARASGLRGVVASPHEIAPIREACGDDFVILTPGIRPSGSDAGDQRRTMTPREAIAAGADYLVVGRPITGAADARSAALKILEEMDA